MAGPTTAALDIAANEVGAAADQMSLHTADPGTTGASEVSGGSYARQTPNYDADTGDGVANLSATLTFNVPAGTTVTHYGLWDTTTFLGGQSLSTSETFASAGTLDITDAPING